MAVAMMSSLSQRNGLVAKVQKQTGVRAVARTRTVTKAISDVNLIVGGSTIGALILGRSLLPVHRAYLAKAGLPKQNGVTHVDAGDKRSAEVSFAAKSNDPAGFTIIDVLAWGALGHAAAFYLLATNSLSAAGVDRTPF
ncbi:hypothetical protein N2152v2_009068 [Parachlorella kessleri]